VLTGAVDVRQGDTRVIADKMDIYMSGSGGLGDGDFERIVASGNFYYLTPDQEVRGNEGIYTKIDDTFTVTGDVILVQTGGNVITGDKLFYNLTTQKARVVGNCEGRKCGSKGRVNILIKGTQNAVPDTAQAQSGDS
jgi:lipopolysaccharide export system protein LptA